MFQETPRKLPLLPDVYISHSTPRGRKTPLLKKVCSTTHGKFVTFSYDGSQVRKVENNEKGRGRL